MFLDPLQTEWMRSGRRLELVRPLRYVHPESGVLYTVPKGETTDLASIPRFFWRILPVMDKHHRAGVLHDWLYRTGRESRVKSDAIFLTAMRDDGVPAWKRWGMWAAVRMFGWLFWGQARRNQENFDSANERRTMEACAGGKPKHGDRCECEICSGPS